MPMKIERRAPTNLFRQERKWRLRDHIRIAAVAKYAALTLAGVLHGCAYMGEKGQGVTLRSLGFSGKNPEELNDFLTEQGEKHASCH